MEPLTEGMIEEEPLTEWTTQELRDSLGWGLYEWVPTVDELLRRERERCAAVCDDMALVLVGHANHGYDVGTILEQAARNIRDVNDPARTPSGTGRQ